VYFSNKDLQGKSTEVYDTFTDILLVKQNLRMSFPVTKLPKGKAAEGN